MPGGVSAPFDVTGIIKQVHLAFRPSGLDAWKGGHATYEVDASPDGFSVRPAEGTKGGAVGAPARFETVSIGRGERRAAPRGVGQVERDGHLALVRGRVTEHLRNGEEGVEQSFAFAEKPEGDGDLTVRVRVTGLEYAGQTAGGHHFADRASGLGVRYGAATWVDAQGARTALEVRWADGELVLRVPHDVVERTAYPALLDPTIGPEFGVDTPAFAGATNEQSQAAVATNGTDYLVAWHDERPTGGQQTFAARVSAAGVVLDPGGFALGAVYPTTSVDLSPAVAFDGTNYLVVWTYWVSSSARVAGARVGPDGVVLDTGAGISISSVSSPRSESLAVAFDGTNYLVVWRDWRTGSAGIYGARVTKAGAVLSGATGFPISVGSGRNPALSFDGTNFLVVWQDQRSGTYDIYGARVSTAGTVLDPSGLPIAVAAGDQIEPSVAFDGTHHFVVWEDRKGTTPDIVAARVDPAGTVLDPAGIPIAVKPFDQQLPAVAFDGTYLIVAWREYAGVVASRVLADGTVLDPADVALIPGSSTYAAAIACRASQCLLVGIGSGGNLPTSGSEIVARRLGGAAALDPAPIHVTLSSNDQFSPAVAFDGTNYLVVWSDDRLIGSILSTNVIGARVSPAGVSLDPAGIYISNPNDTPNDLTPKVVWMAPAYLVVWRYQLPSSNGISAARVLADGTVLDPASITITTSTAPTTAPNVAADGTNYLVVWSSNGSAVKGARLSPAGAVLDATPISIMSLVDGAPAVAYDGTRYLVVAGGSSGHANRVTPAGAVLDGASGFSVPTGNTSAVAYNGVNFIVVGSGSASTRVVAARVTGAAKVLDPVAVGISLGGTSDPRDQPTIACDGATCLVAWRDKRSNHFDIYASFVDSFLTVLNPNGLAVATGGHENVLPAAATAGNGRWLTVYQQDALYPGLGSQRIFGRTIVSQPAGQPCKQASDCASNYCVDGVCCITACGGGSTTDCVACSVAAGAAVDGTCAALTGPVCNDGDACTTGETCQSGVCSGGAPVVCAALDACHDAGTCSPATGLCSNPPKLDGVACDDGNPCTQTDTCQAGVCSGGNPKVCPALDQCHQAGTCDPSTGACSSPAKPDGAACDDGNPCTQTDTCQSGVCAGSNPKTCLASDQCHDAGICDPTTGACSSPAKPDGAACNDGNACTQTDTCQSGVCAGSNPKTCLASDQCHDAGICDPTTGACSNPAKLDGSACNDGNPCTQTDTCQAGICVGGNPKICLAQDECHAAGACDPTSGACSVLAKPNGSPCSAGTCQAGTCVAVPDGGGATSSSGGAGGGMASSTSSSGAGGGTTSSSSSSSGGAGGGTTSSSSSGAGGGTTSSTSSSSGAGGGTTSSTSSSGAGGGMASSSSGVGGGMTSSSSSGATACVPGQQVACPCPGAKPGVQVCRPDGSGFEPCSCVDGAAAGQGGCGCAVPGESQERQSAPVAALALALSIWARRRRERRRGAGGPVDARRAFVEPRGSAHRPSTREELC